MKKLLSLSFISLLALSACNQAVEAPTEPEDEVVVEEEAQMNTFVGDGFTFEYPADWTMEDNEYLFEPGNEEWKVQVFTADAMGGRCSEKVADKEFKDWTYVVMKNAIPADLAELCEGTEESDSRSAEVALEDGDKYFATLFYQYDVGNEDEELANFEKILETVSYN